MVYTGHDLICTEWGLLISSSTILVALRFYARIKCRNSFTVLSDCFLILAWMLQVLASCFDTTLYFRGLFDPENSNTDTTATSSIQTLLIAYISILFYYSALWAIKGAIISVYAPLIPVDTKWHRWALYGLIGYTFVTWIFVILINALWCLPVDRNWSLDPVRNCFAYAIPPVFDMSAAAHLSTDIWLFLLPFPLLRKLKITPRQKLAIAGVFSVGFLGIIATILRIIFVLRSGSLIITALWSCIEIACGIIIATMPLLRILFKRSKAQVVSRKSWRQSYTFGSKTAGSQTIGSIIELSHHRKSKAPDDFKGFRPMSQEMKLTPSDSFSEHHASGSSPPPMPITVLKQHISKPIIPEQKRLGIFPSEHRDDTHSMHSTSPIVEKSAEEPA